MEYLGIDKHKAGRTAEDLWFFQVFSLPGTA
jgi:hypothetical protein